MNDKHIRILGVLAGILTILGSVAWFGSWFGSWCFSLVDDWLQLPIAVAVTVALGMFAGHIIIWIYAQTGLDNE
jgi:hypothetical protein